MPTFKALRDLVTRANVAPRVEREATSTDGLQRMVTQHVRAAGIAPDAIETVVLVGCRGGSLLEMVLERVPAARDIIVLEPDAESLQQLLAKASDDFEALAGDRVYVSTLEGMGSGYSHTLYLELVSFLLARQNVVANTLYIVDRKGEGRGDEAYAGAGLTVHDMFWSAGARFMELLDQTGQVEELFGGIGRRTFLEWAQRLLDQGAWYSALRFLLPLYQTCGDPAVATQITIAWGRLGCARQALKWLKHSNLPYSQRKPIAAELEAAHLQYDEQNRATWAANLEHLARAHPEAAARLREVQPAEADVALVPDVPWVLQMNDGTREVSRDTYPLLVRAGDVLLDELNPPESPVALLQQLENCRVANLSHVCLGAMRDYAGLMNVVHNPIGSAMPNWKQSVYALEERPSVLRRLAEAVDLSLPFAPGRLASLFLGDDAAEQLRTYLHDHSRLLVPQIRFGVSPPVTEALAAVQRSRDERGARARAEVVRAYDDQFPDGVLAKLRGQQPLRVWFWTSIHTTVLQYVARDLVRGFDEIGHHTHLLIEQSPRECIDRSQVVASLSTFKPDLVVLIDHGRPEFEFLPRSIPVINWILDDLPQLTLSWFVEKLSDLDLSFAWSRGLTTYYHEHGYPHCEQLGFAVDPDLYDGDAEGEPENVVGYATHLSFPQEPPFAPGIYRYFERKFMALDELPSGHPQIAPHLEEAVEALGVTIPGDKWNDVAYHCSLVARHVDRVKTASAILDAGLPIALYGRGWEKMPRFRPYARGVVKPGPDLRRVYQSHKVILHINHRCNLHPRVLEASAAGGFVLARSDGDWDFRPGEVNDFLEIGKELCVFSDYDDLVANNRRAIADEPWRQGFAQAARRRVHAEHRYRHRAASMVESLQRKLESLVARRRAIA